jgi:hypothetical protein
MSAWYDDMLIQCCVVALAILVPIIVYEIIRRRSK